jgi:hypothetical protein
MADDIRTGAALDRRSLKLAWLASLMLASSVRSQDVNPYFEAKPLRCESVGPNPFDPDLSRKTLCRITITGSVEHDSSRLTINELRVYVYSVPAKPGELEKRLEDEDAPMTGPDVKMEVLRQNPGKQEHIGFKWSRMYAAGERRSIKVWIRGTTDEGKEVSGFLQNTKGEIKLRFMAEEIYVEPKPVF